MTNQDAERVLPNGATAYVVRYWHEGRLNLGSIHATRASAEAFRQGGDEIEAWGVHDLERHIDAIEAHEARHARGPESSDDVRPKLVSTAVQFCVPHQALGHESLGWGTCKFRQLFYFVNPKDEDSVQWGEDMDYLTAQLLNDGVDDGR